LFLLQFWCVLFDMDRIFLVTMFTMAALFLLWEHRLRLFLCHGTMVGLWELWGVRVVSCYGIENFNSNGQEREKSWNIKTSTFRWYSKCQVPSFSMTSSRERKHLWQHLMIGVGILQKVLNMIPAHDTRHIMVPIPPTAHKIKTP